MGTLRGITEHLVAPKPTGHDLSNDGLRELTTQALRSSEANGTTVARELFNRLAEVHGGWHRMGETHD